jgi:hypothetical protein
MTENTEENKKEHKCNECNKEFATAEALEMHNNSKHFKAPKIKLNKKKIKTWTILITLAVLIIAGGYALTLREQLPGKHDDFAQCLTDAGVKEYGAFWCGKCKEQKALFGRSFKYVNYIECSLPNHEMNQRCQEENIEGYPVWEFADGERINGFLSLETLAEKTNCTLENG